MAKRQNVQPPADWPSEGETSAQPGQAPEARKPRSIAPAPRKRVRLGEAFRSVGLDERALAEAWLGVVEKLSGSQSEADTVEKLLVDVLKECSRILDPPRAAGAGASDAPAVVNLYHNVPRPVRDVRRRRGDAEPE